MDRDRDRRRDPLPAAAARPRRAARTLNPIAPGRIGLGLGYTGARAAGSKPHTCGTVREPVRARRAPLDGEQGEIAIRVRPRTIEQGRQALPGPLPMTIASVRARLLAASPERGVEFGIGHYDTYSMVLVEVADGEGRVGYGEAIARRGGAMTVAAVESLLAPIVVGGEPRDVERHWVAMIDQLRRWGHSGGVVVEALSGVDSAIWDLLGKQEGRPVWELLRGAGRERVPVYASSLYIDAVDAMRAQALEQVERGFSTIKVKIGRSRDERGLAADVEALDAIRDAVGPGVGVVVDANGEYDAATAIRIGRELERLDIGWFEEPVPPDDLDGYARIRQVSTVPLARGETDFSLFGFRELIGRRLIDVVQPDLGRCGGVTGARHVYTLAYASNVDFAPHTGFSGGLSQLAAIHVGAAAPALRAVEYMIIDNPVREIFVGGFPRPERGELAVPDGPGFGLELDHDLVDEYSRPADS